MSVNYLRLIQSMLSPGIMISACGLLLLGMNNKYSLIVNRIRTLNAETRSLLPDSTNEKRRACIHRQLPLLNKRMKLVENAVWLYTIGIALFILAIFSIGISQLSEGEVTLKFSFVFFVLGLLVVLTGIFFAAREVRLGYSIVQLEIGYAIDKNSNNKHS